MNIVRTGVVCAVFILVMSGCAGTQTFSGAARAGDTVAVAVGWRQNLTMNNITVTITTGPPSNRVTQAVYGPNDPAIRAVINLYPDPLSSLLVSPQVGADLTPYAQLYASTVDVNYTGYDKDWSQTVVYVDLPPGLPVGTAQIWVSGAGYANPPASTVEIVAGVGSPIAFATEGASLGPNQLLSMGRVPNQTVSFTGSTIPNAIQIDLAHDPDRDNGGVGKAYVVNTRGDIKSIAWRDDGLNLRVILTPTHNQPLSNLLDFKFNIAGGLTGLHVTNTLAYDANGNTIPGILPVLTASP
jgi:hypothetical protein